MCLCVREEFWGEDKTFKCQKANVELLDQYAVKVGLVKKKSSLDAAIILQTKGQAFEMQLAAFLSKILFQLLFDDD